jgi:membrane protein implicated in regulation of membrane protease activity
MRLRIRDPRFYLGFGIFWILFAIGVATGIIARRAEGPPRALTMFAAVAIAAILFLRYARTRRETVDEEKGWERL